MPETTGEKLPSIAVLPGVDPVEAITVDREAVLTATFHDDPIKRDFRNFLFHIWEHLKLPFPTPIQYDIAQYLQHGPRRLVIEAFRGIGKSWITSAFVCWLLLRDPQLNILVVSASKIRADDFTTFTLRLIYEVECLQHLKPREGQRDSKISFDVGPALNDHAPSVKSVGITGQIAGSRADYVIPDDVEVPGNSQTQTMRDKLSEAVKEFDAVLKPGGRVLFLGTPQTEESVYNRMAERGYEVRIWPARYPTEKEIEMYGPKLAPYILENLKPELVGHSTDPQRFSDLDLLEREASYGRSGFQLQFMLNTRLSDQDRYPLKLSDLIVCPLALTDKGPVDIAWGSGPDQIINDLPNVGFSGDRYHRPAWIAKDKQGDPDLVAFTGSVMFIDPSGRGKDETGYAVVKILHGRLFLTASGGFRDGYSPETLQALAVIARIQAVNLVIVEPNFGDGMFTQLFKPVVARIYPVAVEDAEWSQAQKEKRIVDVLEPVMNQHRLVVAQHLIDQDYRSTENLPQEEALKYQLFYQMTRITREKGALKRDDRLDALAGAVHYWIEQMARDTQKAAQDHRNEKLDKDLERFMEHAMGGRFRSPKEGFRRHGE